MTAETTIRVRGARTHNLKGVDLDLPREGLIGISGPSGSGKSSLAFDTLYAEGQRRYVESLSSYARQFLERMERPDVDSIEGLLPAIAIGRAAPTTTARSTVATVTEVADALRVLFARFGDLHCAGCGRTVRPVSPAEAAVVVAAAAAGARAEVCAPSRATPAALVADGYVSALLADGTAVPLDGLDRLPDGAVVLVDRVPADAAHRTRLAEAVAAAYALGEGRAVVRWDGGRLASTDRWACVECGRPAEPPTPLLFSFNSPVGACPRCKGFGDLLDFDLARCVPEPQRSLSEGAVEPFLRSAHRHMHRKLLAWCAARGIPTETPWGDLSAEHRRLIVDGERRRGGFIGLLPFLRRLERKIYRPHIRFFLRRYRTTRRCPDCAGTRLRAEARAVRLGGATIAEVLSRTVSEALAWVEGLALGGERAAAARLLVGEVRARLRTLLDLGLEYLTLDRLTRTLSGGEAERIHLAAALATRLVETLYVLDEPTVGLHPRDTARLIGALRDLAGLGNCVVVVEHDPDVLRAADLVVEMGPGAGAAGGEVVALGPPAAVAAGRTPTARYLAGAPVRCERAPLVPSGEVVLRGARTNNLRGVDAAFPVGGLTVVSGVSGSGKSSLVMETLVPAVEEATGGAPERVGPHDRIEGAVLLCGVEAIDQAPIQRSSRSNPATYVGAFDGIRAAFAATPEARRRGWGPGHFSFNVRGGRCERCEGEGTVRVEMVFLADLLVPCEDCGGRRYKPEVLAARYKGRTIADVLETTVEEAVDLFRAHPKTVEPLRLLGELGLGYLRLGQPLSTLSGGEAQRLKLAASLLERGGKTAGRRLYVLDEPTTGLHPAEVETLLKILRRLASAGHAVVVIEHHLGVIAAADHVIDLGPEAGAGGGRVVYAGPPDGLARAPTHTGRHLKEYLAP